MFKLWLDTITAASSDGGKNDPIAEPIMFAKAGGDSPHNDAKPSAKESIENPKARSSGSPLRLLRAEESPIALPTTFLFAEGIVARLESLLIESIIL
jgi:hypothetical protein